MAVEAEAVEGTAAWITEGSGCGGGSSTTCSWLPATAADGRPDTAAVSVRGPAYPPAVGVCVCQSVVRAVPLLSVSVCVSVRGLSCPPAVGVCVCRSAV